MPRDIDSGESHRRLTMQPRRLGDGRPFFILIDVKMELQCMYSHQRIIMDDQSKYVEGILLLTHKRSDVALLIF